MAIGTDDQKRAMIGPILSGDVIWCQGFSEPGAGSDLAALKTRAVDNGDAWIVNGQKVWTSNARYADKMFCLARTSTEDRPHRGITMLLIDMNSPGVEVRPLKQISGALDFGEVFLTDVRVPKVSVVGQVGDGWNVAMLLLSYERGSSAVEKYHQFRPELDDLVQLAKTTIRGEEAAASDPLVRQRIAQSYIELEVLRLHSLHVLTKVQRNEDLGPESSITKLQWSETHQDLYEVAVDVLGEASLLGDESATLGLTPIQHRYLWSRAGTIYGGSSQVQRNIIAERVLGLPR
jgi:alkylation response protein AidB-like acyl-CoA dehydrogenase